MTQNDAKKEVTYGEIVEALGEIEKGTISPDEAREWLENIKKVLQEVEPGEKIPLPRPRNGWIFHRCRSVLR